MNVERIAYFLSLITTNWKGGDGHGSLRMRKTLLTSVNITRT